MKVRYSLLCRVTEWEVLDCCENEGVPPAERVKLPSQSSAGVPPALVAAEGGAALR